MIARLIQIMVEIVGMLRTRSVGEKFRAHPKKSVTDACLNADFRKKWRETNYNRLDAMFASVTWKVRYLTSGTSL